MKEYKKHELTAQELDEVINPLTKKPGNYYWRHINAMTAEDLRSKSEIAQELAYRDLRIDELRAKVDELELTILKLFV